MASNTCEMNVGRLMEIRVAAGYSCVDDVAQMIQMMAAHVRTLPPGSKYVIAADWRRVTTMSPDTAARAREMFERSNPRVIRSAILTLPERSLTNLQVVRLVREAELENRRLFTHPGELSGWLGEVLTDAERARLSQFLGGEPPLRASGSPSLQLRSVSLEPGPGGSQRPSLVPTIK